MQYLRDNKDRGDCLTYNFRISDMRTSDFIDYAVYEAGSTEKFSEEKLQEMQVLEKLYNLGFPRDHSGTYLYKAMIMKALHHLNGFDDIGLPISEEQLLEQMESPFSQFYLETARYDLDIGIKTFHSCIQDALDEVEYADVDSDVISDIYGDFSEDTNYGKHAFVIAKRIHDCNKEVQIETGETKGHQYVKTMATAIE